MIATWHKLLRMRVRVHVHQESLEAASTGRPVLATHVVHLSYMTLSLARWCLTKDSSKVDIVSGYDHAVSVQANQIESQQTNVERALTTPESTTEETVETLAESVEHVQLKDSYG